MASDGVNLEVAQYMRDERISEPEARQRLHDQSLMAVLEQRIEDRLSPGAFGGMWVDREDDDRIALALVPGRAGFADVVAEAHPVVAALGLDGRVNFVEATISYRELSALRETIEARVAGVNANATSKVDVVEDVRTGTVELGVPATLTSAQKSVLADPNGPIASPRVREVPKIGGRLRLDDLGS